MATNWITLAKADVDAVLNTVVGAAAAYDPGMPGGVQPAARYTALISATVERVRGSVRNGGRVPLSLTAATIPPDAKMHAVYLVVEALTSSTPQIGEFVGKGESLGWAIKDAREWIDKVASGERQVVAPTDPDPDETPTGPAWGNESDIVDMTTD